MASSLLRQVTFGFWTVCRSVLIYLGAPLVAGIITRYGLIYARGEKWYNEKFMPWFGPVALISLIYTIIVLFALQGHQVGPMNDQCKLPMCVSSETSLVELRLMLLNRAQVIARIGDVFRIAVPLSLYFCIMWAGTFVLFWKLG